MARASEGGTHWYDQKGSPCYTVIGANGKERNTTLRDARKENLVPSVTTILGVAAKPALEVWKINQALMAALTLPKNEGESLDDFMARAKQDSKEQAIEAAERGTEIHADIEKGFLGEDDNVAYRAVQEALEALEPGREWVAEDSFCSEDGYGGKIDLYANGVVVDFKTKDNLKGKDPAKLVYDEHGMQLSAYANGLEFLTPIRISVFVDRADPSIVLIHKWDAESHQRHLGMFVYLLNYWFLLKKYRPEIKDAPTLN
jgi:hypothetical protein|tara:strand:- start:6935 stop:7708 length:774 start_codon:yes stop_codon:yes gene_type:complete